MRSCLFPAGSSHSRCSRFTASTHACTYLLRSCSCAIPRLGYSTASVQSSSPWIPFPRNIPSRNIARASSYLASQVLAATDGGRQHLRVPQLSRCGVLPLTGHLSILFLSGPISIERSLVAAKPQQFLPRAMCQSFYRQDILRPLPSCMHRAEAGVPVLQTACFGILFRTRSV